MATPNTQFSSPMTPGASPRPAFDQRSSTSRPACRIRRLQATPEGEITRSPDLLTVPESALSPPPARRLLFRRGRGGNTPEGSPTVPTRSPRVQAAVEQALEPGEVARVVHHPSTGPTLAAVPENVAVAADNDARERAETKRARSKLHKHKHHHRTSVDSVDARPDRTIPIPPTSTEPGSVRPETVAAVETRNGSMNVPEASPNSRKSWWHFGRKKEEDTLPGPGAVPLDPNTNPRDFAPGAGDPARQGEFDSGQYAEDIVDWLDVIDPEVATVSTLSNVQNSLFLPDLGRLYNRMPLIDLSRRRGDRVKRRAQHTGDSNHVSAFAPIDEVSAAAEQAAGSSRADEEKEAQRRYAERLDRRQARRDEAERIKADRDSRMAEDGSFASPEVGKGEPKKSEGFESAMEQLQSPRAGSPVSDASSPPLRGRSPTHSFVRRRRSDSASSSSSSSSESSISEDEQELRRRERLMRSRSTIRGEYAVLPAGIAWDNWTAEEREELDDHVRHLMHSKKERWRRRGRGFLQFVKRPAGFLITLYASLITFWGTAWVLFLIGWVSLGDRKAVFIEIADQILVALFAMVGIGFAPFRAVDTYHMIFIAHYHHLTWRLRREQNLPKLEDRNDLPAPQALDPDLEAQFKKDREAPVLSEEQQRKLTHHQMKYHKSHTFYRPHETPTHRAFPLALLVTITVLLDFHSMFQMALAGTTWGINYKVRPAPLTATILCCSLTCNITAGIIIAIGGRRTRKVEEVEKRLRQALTEEAMHRMEKRQEEERKAKEEGPKELGLTGTISRKTRQRLEGIREKTPRGSSEDVQPLRRNKGRSTTSVEKGKHPMDSASPSEVEVVDRMTVPRSA